MYLFHFPTCARQEDTSSPPILLPGDFKYTVSQEIPFPGQFPFVVGYAQPELESDSQCLLQCQE